MRDKEMNTGEITKEDREEAIRFYFHSLTGIQIDWVEKRLCEESMDPDVVALARLLSAYRQASETRGFLAGLASVIKGMDSEKIEKNKE
jgi:hypothetical protein